MTTLRILFWFAIAAAAMLGAVWLAERPGTLTAEWQGWRLDTNVGVVLIAIVVLILVGIAAWLLYRWIVGAPFALLEGFAHASEESLDRLRAGMAPSDLEAAVDHALGLTDDTRQAFTPLLAIHSARHEVQYSRLFRS